MAQKYKPWQHVVNGDLSANMTATGSDVSDVDNIGLEFVWTGTPTGVLKLQASNDSTDGSNGTWTDHAATFPAQPAGGASSTIVPLVSYCFKWLRVVYTKTSGTGTLQVYAFGKNL